MKMTEIQVLWHGCFFVFFHEQYSELNRISCSHMLHLCMRIQGVHGTLQHTLPSLGNPRPFPEGKVWAQSCANHIILECRNLTAGLC